jgi:hypothetical protein
VPRVSGLVLSFVVGVSKPARVSRINFCQGFIFSILYFSVQLDDIDGFAVVLIYALMAYVKNGLAADVVLGILLSTCVIGY